MPVTPQTPGNSASKSPVQNASALALFTGSLDSILAAKVVLQQDIAVTGICLQTPFTRGAEQARRAADGLGISLRVITAAESYLDLVRRPRFGYATALAPCLDCRIWMYQQARTVMVEMGATFLITGDVIGQKPAGQRRQDFETVDHHAAMAGQVLRPLSARLLPMSQPEQQGAIVRQNLYSLQGQGRKELFALARKLGVEKLAEGASGGECLLTDAGYVSKVRDLLAIEPAAESWEFALLRIGRHFRLTSRLKAIVGKNQTENEQLAASCRAAPCNQATLLKPHDWNGPSVLITGQCQEQDILSAAGLLGRFARLEMGAKFYVQVEGSGKTSYLCVLMTNDSFAPADIGSAETLHQT